MYRSALHCKSDPDSILAGKKSNTCRSYALGLRFAGDLQRRNPTQDFSSSLEMARIAGARDELRGGLPRPRKSGAFLRFGQNLRDARLKFRMRQCGLLQI